MNAPYRLPLSRIAISPILVEHESLDEVREYGNGDEIVMRCRSCIYFFAAVPPDLEAETEENEAYE